MKRTTSGEKIKELRIMHNLTQKELADKLGYQSNTAIYLIEKNEKGVPFNKLRILAKLFHVSIEDLIGYPESDSDIEKKHLLKLTIIGDGLNLRRDVNMYQAGQIISFLNISGTCRTR